MRFILPMTNRAGVIEELVKDSQKFQIPFAGGKYTVLDN